MCTLIEVEVPAHVSVIYIYILYYTLYFSCARGSHAKEKFISETICLRNGIREMRSASMVCGRPVDRRKCVARAKRKLLNIDLSRELCGIGVDHCSLK